MEYTLTMTFLTEKGEKINISISDVKNDLSEASVIELMDILIANNIFENKKGNPISKYSASITERKISKIDLK